MIHKKLISLLVLLMAAVSGAWAQQKYNVTFDGFDNPDCNITVNDVTLPFSKTFGKTDADADADNIKASTNEQIVKAWDNDGESITIKVISAFEGTIIVEVYGDIGYKGNYFRSITVTCVPTYDYKFTVADSEHGSGTVKFYIGGKKVDGAYIADEGKTVTMTITPDASWVIDGEGVKAQAYTTWGAAGAPRRTAANDIQILGDVTLQFVNTDTQTGARTYSFTMPSANVLVSTAYKKMGTLYFDPADKTDLMEVKVGGTARNVENNQTVKIEKVENVLEGTPVKLTANQGYQFRKVVVKQKVVDTKYMKWDNGQKTLVATEIPATVTTVENANTDVTWSAGTYLVEGNVTIGGTITLSGNVELIIKDGAKLNTSQITGNNDYSLSVYGQSNMSGELKVACSNNDAINKMQALNIHSCKVNASCSYARCGGFFKITAFKVYGGSVDAEYTGDTEGYGMLNTPLNIYGGEVKAVGKGNGNFSYGIVGDTGTTVKVYGGKLWAECAGKSGINSSNVSLTKEGGFNGKIETSSDGTSWTEYTNTGTPNAPYVRVGY